METKIDANRLSGIFIKAGKELFKQKSNYSISDIYDRGFTDGKSAAFNWVGLWFLTLLGSTCPELDTLQALRSSHGLELKDV